MQRFLGFLVLLVLGFAAREAGAAEPTSTGAAWSCYYRAAHVTVACVAQRDEAEGELYQSNQSCAQVVYVRFDGRRAFVRCVGYDASLIDYISDGGPLRVLK